MAHVTKIEDYRYNLVRYPVRYRMYFHDRSWVVRSRRFKASESVVRSC